mgnify:CR=1 FL=1
MSSRRQRGRLANPANHRPRNPESGSEEVRIMTEIRDDKPLPKEELLSSLPYTHNGGEHGSL